MQNYVKFLKTTVLTLACLSLTGCIDDSYDLEDIDLTIGSKVNLTLPSSSTGDIVLKNIMDLEEDGIVKVIDGKFYLEEDGSANIPEIVIDPVKLPKPQLSPIEADVNLNVDDLDGFQNTMVKSKAPRKVSIGGFEIPEGEYYYTITDMDKTSFGINTESDAVTQDIVALSEVKFKDGTQLVVDIKTSLKNGADFFKMVHLDDLFINYPKGLNIKRVVCKHWSYRKNEETGLWEDYINIHDAASFNNETGKLDLTDGGNVEIGVNKSIEITIEFDKAIMGDDKDLKFNDGKISMQGQFQVGGTFHVETRDLELLYSITDEDDRNAIIQRFIMKYMQGGLNAIIPEQISFKGSANFDNDIEISGFKGEIEREVGEIEPIRLNNLPDFLNDPEVVLDLANPVIYVDVNNPLPADAETEIIIQSMYDDADDIVKRTGNIVVPKEQRTIFCLADNFENVEHPQDYKGVNVVNVRIEKLNELLKKIPEEIKVDVAPIRMKIDDMKIPNSYTVGVDYKIYTPLAFGEDFKLVYQGTEDGWAADMGDDFGKIDAQEISLTAKAYSTLPLDLKLTIELLDEYGRIIDGLAVDQLEIIKAKSEGTVLSFSIKPAKGHTIKEFLSGKNGQKLDGVRYKAIASAENSDVLMEDASITLKDIRVTVKGDVSYDAN